MTAELTLLSGSPSYCPNCPGVRLPPGPAVIPGTFSLFETQCPNCGTGLLAHFSTVYARNSAITLAPQTGELKANRDNDWYSHNLSEAWRNRQTRPVRIERSNLRSLRKPLLVNCIDFLFGHCLHRLFDLPRLMQAYPDRDIVVLVQDFARWLVPDGVAEIWSVDIALRDGRLWFDDLVRQVRALLADLPPAEIVGEIAMGGTQIEKFSRTATFDHESPLALERTKVTLIWRSDRCWLVNGAMADHDQAQAMAEQIRLFTSLAMTLRQEMPDVEIAMAGIGREGSFPDWIDDQRVQPGARIDEMAWLKLYSESQVVVGVHGSNMLLPAAHAATTIELVPPGKWQHTGDSYDFMARTDALHALREVRFLPMSIPVRELAGVVQVMIRNARVASYWAQHYKLDQDGQRALQAKHAKVFVYPGV